VTFETKSSICWWTVLTLTIHTEGEIVSILGCQVPLPKWARGVASPILRPPQRTKDGAFDFSVHPQLVVVRTPPRKLMRARVPIRIA
jgi:hypothetical protein